MSRSRWVDGTSTSETSSACMLNYSSSLGQGLVLLCLAIGSLSSISSIGGIGGIGSISSIGSIGSIESIGGIGGIESNS
jgi:hypothetical protein